MENYNLHLGYACLNMELRAQGIYTSRTIIIKKLLEKGLQEARNIALKNLDDLEKIIHWNEKRSIRFYRLSSQLFPHMENPLITKNFSEIYDLEFAKERLAEIGKLIRKFGHRITMHPGQFVQLGSPRQEVIEQSIKDLTAHAQILKYMGLSPEKNGSVLIIHGGGRFNDKLRTLNRWKETFENMPKWVAQYIVLENDEWNYGIDDLLPVCEELQIPLCLDVFHNSIADFGIELTNEILQHIFNTWKVRKIPIKMHFSNQEPNERKGTHSQSVNSIPQFIRNWPVQFKTDIWLCLEVKDKEQSVLRMLEKYYQKKIINKKIYYYLK